jgi:hypothetical protein
MCRHLGGCADTDNRAASLATFGTEVNDPVRRADDVEIVLDDDDRMAALDELVNASSNVAMSSECRPVVGSSNRNRVRLARRSGRDARRVSTAALRRR